ncbi:alpha/beta fold hydrolase [Pedobacter sp. MW01-1-1]|uniref:alpha/beta fold hydrolase n=1 Tax=Pedobacter sp. MW01-1-1 TaxID=3383027 RepID=UPI003FEFDC5C
MLKHHSFDHPLAKLSYYTFGNGPESMLCFHGYGMHGKQFSLLEQDFGARYTFYGFDLFFHKETHLKNQSLTAVKAGISKAELANFILDFCTHAGIDRFSVLGYSMGTHYATTLVERLPEKIKEYIVVAPSAFAPGKLVEFFSKNKIGNKSLEKLVLSEKALINLLSFCKKLGFIDQTGYNIMLKEINTQELRFSLYACFTYLRFLETDKKKVLDVLQRKDLKSVFIFGKRDKMYPPEIGKKISQQVPNATIVVLDENHDMIKQPFVEILKKALL